MNSDLLFDLNSDLYIDRGKSSSLVAGGILPLQKVVIYKLSPHLIIITDLLIIEQNFPSSLLLIC